MAVGSVECGAAVRSVRVSESVICCAMLPLPCLVDAECSCGLIWPRHRMYTFYTPLYCERLGVDEYKSISLKGSCARDGDIVDAVVVQCDYMLRTFLIPLPTTPINDDGSLPDVTLKIFASSGRKYDCNCSGRAVATHIFKYCVVQHIT